MSKDPEGPDHHSQLSLNVSSDEGDRAPEFVFGSRRMYWLTRHDQRLVRWITGIATFLLILVGTAIRSSDLPFGRGVLIGVGVFAAIGATASAIIWVHLRLTGAPSEAVRKEPFRLSLRPSSDDVIWSLAMICGISSLAVAIFLFVIGEELAHHAFEPKDLVPLGIFLTIAICTFLGWRWARKLSNSNRV